MPPLQLNPGWATPSSPPQPLPPQLYQDQAIPPPHLAAPPTLHMAGWGSTMTILSDRSGPPATSGQQTNWSLPVLPASQKVCALLP